MEKRAILAIILSFLIIYLFQTFVFKPETPQQTAPAPAQKTEAKETPPVQTSPASKAAPAATQAAAAPARTQGPGQDIAVETPFFSAVFNTRGASLKSFKLNHYNQTLKPGSPLIELVDIKEGITGPLSVSFPGSSVNVSADEIYSADRRRISLQGSDSQQLAFSLPLKGGIKIEKIFTFYGDRYNFDLEVRVVNSSGVNLSQKPLLIWSQYADPKAEEDSYGHQGPIFSVKKDVTTESPNKVEKKTLGPDTSWAGYESKYFISAMIPKQPSLTNLVLSRAAGDTIFVGLEGPVNLIPPGQAGSFQYALFLGPKEFSILQAQKVGLEESVDFGSWIKWLAIPLLLAIKFLYQYVHNYGLAIIILTVIIKIIFWPLGNKSYKSMKQMQQLQPKITELRERYKNDKQKLNQEVMQLYRLNKINPLGGCLPVVIQIPVFFGLYKALLYSIELRHSPFVFWIQDLSEKDPYYITPIIMGATMFWQQKISPQVGDPMQQKVMLLMPIIFTFLFLNFPSGLVIYWLFNNILSIAQQYYINKKM
ncbi:MAG TPA: membrane protein insertase YidC [Syntrophales bacterium]|nr:membrane protein insertase YidC [Syntrophales bacterium]